MSSSTAIFLYSRSGHSRKVARWLKEHLPAELIETEFPQYASPIFGYARAGFDSLRQNRPALPDLPDLKTFDLLILCGPVWTSYPSTPLRALLSNSQILPDKVALALTNGDHSPPEKAYATAESDLTRPLVATCCISNAIEGTPQMEEQLKAFVEDVRTNTLSKTSA